MSNSTRLEPTTPDDLYYNYCWWPYTPVAPTENKLRPAALLFHTFELAGIDERAYDIVHTLRKEIGLFRTVWGAKMVGGLFGWEYYFYDYQRRERNLSITRVLSAIRPHIACTVPVNENLAYFMFSIDINQELVTGARALDVVHMYVGNPGSIVSSGIAYGVRAEGTTLENFYFFFDANQHLRDAAAKIACSGILDATQIDLNRVLWPELRGCHTICVANKLRHDTVYFSGITTAQLLFFLKALAYPSELVRFVETERSRFDHLLWDVGFDYTMRGGQLQIEKSGFYGVF
jgi:hypothetical protein